MKNPLFPRRAMYLVTGLFLLLLSGTYKQTLAIALNQATATNTPGTVPSFTPTDTPATDTPTNTPTNTPPPATSTATNTPIPATATPTQTQLPPTNTPTYTPLPATSTATNTPIPATPTQTQLPATSTPTNTSVSATPTPTQTQLPATDTPSSTPTDTPVPPTATPVPATATHTPASNNNPATNTPAAPHTPTPTVTPSPLSEPTSLAQAIAQVISYPALFPESNLSLLEDFDLTKAQALTAPVEITVAGEIFTAQLMTNENGQIVLVVVQDGETRAYQINTKSPLYKAARFLHLIQVSAEVTVNFEGKSYRAIMVLDPTTGQLYYLMAKITTADDGTVSYGVVLKLDVSTP